MRRGGLKGLDQGNTLITGLLRLDVRRAHAALDAQLQGKREGGRDEGRDEGKG